MYSALVLWKPRTSNALILNSYYIYLIIIFILFTYDEYLFRFQYFIGYLFISSNFSWATEIRNECCIKETSVSFSPPQQPGATKQNCSFFYSPSLFKTQKKQLIWDPFFYGCPRAAKLNNTSKMVSYDRQTRHQCIVLHRLLSNFFWSHWTLTSKY